MLLGEHPGVTGRLLTRPASLQPHDLDRAAEAGGVDHPDRAAAVALGDHTTGAAALRAAGRLHRHRQPLRLGGDAYDSEAGQPDQHIARSQ